MDDRLPLRFAIFFSRLSRSSLTVFRQDVITVSLEDERFRVQSSGVVHLPSPHRAVEKISIRTLKAFIELVNSASERKMFIASRESRTVSQSVILSNDSICDVLPRSNRAKVSRFFFRLIVMTSSSALFRGSWNFFFQCSRVASQRGQAALCVAVRLFLTTTPECAWRHAGRHTRATAALWKTSVYLAFL